MTETPSPVTLNVNFENSNKFFFEGEKLSVRIQVSIEQPVSIYNISACFLGLCSCSVTNSDKLSTSKSSSKREEVYFDATLPVFVAADEDSARFGKGSHEYSVEYQLPCSLPTSVESPQGHIRYSLHVTALVGDDILKSTSYFTVVSKLNLNRDTDGVHLPVVMWKHENQCMLSFLCGRSGPLRAFVHIPKKGFVPGEMITVNADVRNFNRAPINWVKACLVQVLKYNCGRPWKRKRVVAQIIRGCVLPYDSQAWRSESLYIPAVPPTTRPAKRMINVKYKLYFLIKASWLEKTVSLKQNLVIGAVPLMECREAEERGQGEGEGMLNSYSCHYSNLEPCIFGPYSIEEESSNLSFSPIYPIYTEL